MRIAIGDGISLQLRASMVLRPVYYLGLACSIRLWCRKASDWGLKMRGFVVSWVVRESGWIRQDEESWNVHGHESSGSLGSLWV